MNRKFSQEDDNIDTLSDEFDSDSKENDTVSGGRSAKIEEVEFSVR